MDFWKETTCGLKLLMEIYCNMSEAESFTRHWWRRVRSQQNTDLFTATWIQNMSGSSSGSSGKKASW